MSLINHENIYADITAFYALNLSNFEMDTHQHESCEIMYVTKGQCMVKTNESEKHYLNEGDFILLDSFVSHQLHVEDTATCFLLNLEFDCSQKGQIDIKKLRSYCPILSDSTILINKFLFAHDNFRLKQPLEALIEALSKEYQQRKTAENTLLIELLFHQCLLEIVPFLKSQHLNEHSYHLEKALMFINENLTGELRVNEIASSVGINKSYLHSLFKQQLNETITGYINRKRLEKSKFLLINTNMSIIDIAFQVGFNSRQHFSRMFRQYYKMNPQNYRIKKNNSTHSSNGQLKKNIDRWNLIEMK